MEHTPHSWSSHTVACFPPALAEFFAQHPITREDKTALKRNVDAEYRTWKSEKAIFYFCFFSVRPHCWRRPRPPFPTPCRRDFVADKRLVVRRPVRGGGGHPLHSPQERWFLQTRSSAETPSLVWETKFGEHDPLWRMDTMTPPPVGYFPRPSLSPTTKRGEKNNFLSFLNQFKPPPFIGSPAWRG